MKLSVRLPLLIILVVAIPAAIVFYLGYKYIHDELHAYNESKLQAIAKIRTEQIKDHLDWHEARVLSMSKDPTLVELIAKKERDSLGVMLSYMLPTMPDIERITIFDSNTNFIISSGKAHLELSKQIAEAIKKISKESVYTYVYNDNKPKIRMIKGVYKEDKIIGYLSYTFGQQWLNAITKEHIGLGKTGEIVIAGWGDDKNAYYLTKRRHMASGQNGSMVDFGKDRLAMGYALKGFEGFSHDFLDYRSVPVISSSSFISKYGVAVVVKMDIEEAHENVRKIMAISVTIFGATLAILIAIIWLVLHRLGVRIDRYADIASKITDGDLSVRICDDKNDEMGRLATAFDSVTSKLVSMNQELEKLVLERTQKLLATENLFQNTFESANVGLAHVSPDGKFVRINNAFCQIVGYEKEEMLSIGFANITHPDDIEPDMKMVKELLDGKKDSYAMQKRYIHKNGSVVWVLLTVVLIRDKEGVPEYFISAVQDITTIKRLEEKNLELLTRLQASNSDLQQFAYIASHDLQEPLRMISSYLQLIEKRYRELLGDEGKEFMDYAIDGAVRMQSLINGLLEFSRVNTKGGEFLQVDMNEVIELVKHDLSIQIEEAKAKIESSHLPTIVADKNQMGQLLRNLIGNAIKYKSEAKPVVSISCDEDSEYWVFSVKDNGIGIKKEYFEKIFLIFQRLHSKEEYPGTGIGLAVCKRIIDRHGGKIWVESELGHGSKFYFSISKKLGEQ